MINFTEEGLHAYLAEDDGGPVVMLNLLRFATNGGASKYSEYVRRIGASGINERYGVELIYGGSGTSALVAEAGQEWDLVALVRYPLGQDGALVLQIANIGSIALGTVIRYLCYRRWVFPAAEPATA